MAGICLTIHRTRAIDIVRSEVRVYRASTNPLKLSRESYWIFNSYSGARNLTNHRGHGHSRIRMKGKARTTMSTLPHLAIAASNIATCASHSSTSHLQMTASLCELQRQECSRNMGTRSHPHPPAVRTSSATFSSPEIFQSPMTILALPTTRKSANSN